MKNNLKPFSRKEKAVAAVVTSALVTAPFLFSPAFDVNVSAADSGCSSSVEYPIDKLASMVMPATGSYITLDLNAIYGPAQSTFVVTKEYGNSASSMESYAEQGILKIYPSHEGRTTFSIRFTQGCHYYVDRFDVITDASISPSESFHRLGIADMLQQITNLPNDSSSASIVKQILSGLGPIYASDIAVNNQPPTLVSEGSLKKEISVNETVTLPDLAQYFTDPDNDAVEVTILPQTHEHIQLYQDEDTGDWKMSGLNPGIEYVGIVARDGRGGLREAQLQVTVSAGPHVNHKPNLVADQPIVKHFTDHSASDGASMGLSYGSEIDLRELFADADGDELHFKYVADYQLTSANIVSREFDLDGTNPVISWAALPSGVRNITKLIAYDEQHESDPVELSVYIDDTYIDPFPDQMDMYESNAAGTSSYIFNFHRLFGSYLEIESSDIHISEGSSVTASVYDDERIKLDVVGPAGGSPSKIKFYAHSRETAYELYQDDANINIISPYDTPDPDDHSPAISLARLYPYYGGYLGDLFQEDRVTVVPNLPWTFETGSTFTMHLNVNGTQGTFIIDPDAGTDDSGSQVFIIPFIREPAGA